MTSADIPKGFTVACVAADPMGSCVTSCASFRTGGLACSPWARVQCSGCGKEEPTNTHLATCEDLRRLQAEPIEFARADDYDDKDSPMMHDLRTEIQTALNKHSAENGSNTPDFILAEYLTSCLSAFDRATQAREEWHSPTMDESQKQAGGVPDPTWP